MAFAKLEALLEEAKSDTPKDDAPSPTDIDEALKIATEAKDMGTNEYLSLCAAASPRAVSDALIAICKQDEKTVPNKWELINKLCVMTAENKPSQNAINQALSTSVSSKKKDLVLQLCLMNADNAPKAPLYQLYEIFPLAKGDWDFLRKLTQTKNPSIQIGIGKLLAQNKFDIDIYDLVNNTFKQSILEMEKLYHSADANQTDTSNALVIVCELDKKIVPNKWNIINSLCAITAENKPNQDAIDIAWKAAAKEKDWDFVKKQCQSTNNPPSQAALGWLLRQAGYRPFRERPFDSIVLSVEIMKHLFEQSINKPSTEDVNDTLSSICIFYKEGFDARIKAIVSYLCALSGDNRPSPEVMNKVMETSFSAKMFDLVRSIGLRDGDNAPSQEVVAKIVFESAALETGYLSASIIKSLCEKATNKPSQKNTSAAVLKTRTTYPIKWAYLQYFCSMQTENRPNQEDINKVLEQAVGSNSEFVKFLCTSNNPPSQKAVSSILHNLCQLKYHWTNSEKLKSISYLCALTGENKPEQPIIKEVLLKAVLYNNQELVKALCMMTTDNAPLRADIELALEQATTIEMVQCLCELNKNAPGPEAIDKKLMAVVSDKNNYTEEKALTLVQYFCELKINPPSHESIDKALKEAISYRSLVIVKTLYELGVHDQEAIKEVVLYAANFGATENLQYLLEKVEPSHKQDVIKLALKEAALFSFSLDNVKYLCELEELAPDQEAIEEAVIEADNGPFQYLFEKIDSSRQKNVIEKVLNVTTNEDIRSYLEVSKEKEPLSNPEMETKSLQQTETYRETDFTKPYKSTFFPKAEQANRQVAVLEEDGLSNRPSCFSEAQIAAINARITELRTERDSFSFLKMTDRKNQKINGLEELLRKGQEAGMTIEDAIAQVQNDPRFKELREGIIFTRTQDLLNGLIPA